MISKRCVKIGLIAFGAVVLLFTVVVLSMLAISVLSEAIYPIVMEVFSTDKWQAKKVTNVFLIVFVLAAVVGSIATIICCVDEKEMKEKHDNA
jgi:uncharacterized membrane protein (DUF106 family)